MLSEHYRELLTAYVDGEISGRQRRALHKLLRRSPEARKLLKEMQADSDEIRALPPARLEQDLSDSVLTLIAQRQIQLPKPPVAAPALMPVATVPRSSLLPYAVGVMAILLAVFGASLLLFYLVFRFLI
jgi:anti-sigma factor RsiW